jgi:HAD superfamily phosphatase (TIGR01681 family)
MQILSEAGLRQDMLPNIDARLSPAILAADAVSRQDWATAERHWREAIETEPAAPHFHISLAVALGKLGRQNEAEAMLVSASEKFPKDSSTWSVLAQLAEQRLDWKTAEQHWRRFLELDNQSAWPYEALARALRLQRKFDAAAALLADSQARFPDELWIYSEQARLAQDRRDWPFALSGWQKVQNRFPEVWDGYGGLFAVLSEMGCKDEAQAVLETAISHFPNDVAALDALATAAESRGDWPAAEQYWRRFLKIAPGVGRAHMALARALQGQGRSDEVDAVQATALALLPSDLSVLSELARLAEHRGDWQLSLTHWQAVRAAFPKLLYGYTGQAVALSELGRFEDSEALLLTATLLFPDEIEPANLLSRLKKRRDVQAADNAPVLETEPFDAVVRSHNGKGFLTPTTLRVTPDKPLRIALIGSCQLDSWQLQTCAPAGAAFESITVNHLSPLPVVSPEEVARFDLMVLQIALRSILHDGALWGLAYDDLDGFQRVFDMCCDRISQRLDLWLKWNEDHGLLCFVGNFLVPQDGGMGRLFPRYDLRNTQYFVERLNEHLERAVRSRRNAYIFDIDRIVASLGRRFIQDDVVEFISHGSFMSLPPAVDDRIEPMEPLLRHYDIDWPGRLGPAIWSELMAMYRTARQIDPVKLVVVDLDDTLWKGVSGDMADLDPSEMLGFWPMGFVEALTWVKKRGILLAILSKNEEQRIREIFPKIFGPKLPLSDFAAVMVNWRPKPEGMAEILETMNLLPRNVIFIDDNPGERAAMQVAFPAMRIIGRYPYYLRRTLLWSAETQVLSVTEESGRRTEMIQRQFEREGKRRELPREDFLREASPQVRMMLIRISSIRRAAAGN